MPEDAAVLEARHVLPVVPLEGGGELADAIGIHEDVAVRRGPASRGEERMQRLAFEMQLANSRISGKMFEAAVRKSKARLRGNLHEFAHAAESKRMPGRAPMPIAGPTDTRRGVFPCGSLKGASRITHGGSPSAIPAFLGRPEDGRPWAEVWFGSHPVAPSTLADGRSLERAIAEDPRRMLGEGVIRAFGDRLPICSR